MATAFTLGPENRTKKGWEEPRRGTLGKLTSQSETHLTPGLEAQATVKILYLQNIYMENQSKNPENTFFPRKQSYVL